MLRFVNAVKWIALFEWDTVTALRVSRKIHCGDFPGKFDEVLVPEMFKICFVSLDVGEGRVVQRYISKRFRQLLKDIRTTEISFSFQSEHLVHFSPLIVVQLFKILLSEADLIVPTLILCALGSVSFGLVSSFQVWKKEMEKNNNHHNPERLGRLEGDALLRPITTTLTSETRLSVATSSDFVLQWGNRKRLRYMKIQVKDKSDSASDAPVHKTTVRVDRRVVRSDNSTSTLNQPTTNDNSGYLILRQRPSSPSHHILRNSESSIAMKGHGNGLWGLASPDRGGAQDKSTTVTNKSNHNDNYKEGGGGGGASESSETGHDSKKGRVLVSG
ncbi:hypothetical protein F0562_006953 [Nyssa sinensis]|uniref:Uncharacterized protein n=1 Tax=Nyssa sinensis TaxID=561372 RepID=A0A5J5A2S5_9ASTE|nr:hypothetical protein F0562_006953 [Nyssa sinensis]